MNALEVPRGAPIVVTGANGFVGRALCARLAQSFTVRAVTRNVETFPAGLACEVRRTAEAEALEDWATILRGAGAVVHLAALVHQLGEQTSAGGLAEPRRVNTTTTLTLARAALGEGVRQFVFVSTAGVHGARSFDAPLTESSPIRPTTAYARSKAEAEEGLMRLAEASSLQVTIFRPPMVYGSAAPGNFARLRRLLESGVPVPLGGSSARRSIAYVGNLVEAITSSLSWADANGTYLVGDPEPCSPAELLRLMAAESDRRLWLVPVPVPILRAWAWIVGRAPDVDKLTLPFELSIDRLRLDRGWTPPFTTAEGIRRTMLTAAP